MQWAAGTLPLRCVRRFVLIDGRNRSLIIAGQAFTTVIPLLIITASVASETGGASVGENLVARFHLSGDAADAMRSLFRRPPNATGAISILGVVVLLASLLSLTRSLQRVYEAAWGLRAPRGLPSMVNGLTGMSLLAAQLIVLGLLASALRGVPAGSFIAAILRLVLLVPVWWLLQFLLLSRRIPARRLLPGAFLAAVGQVVVTLVSALWMPRAVAINAERYGLIGVTFALITWLIIVALAIVVGAVISAEIAPSAAEPGVAGPGAGEPAEPGVAGPERPRPADDPAHPPRAIPTRPTST
jgi:membrane protein